MSLPGRVSGVRDYCVTVLPPTHTYAFVYRTYVEASKLESASTVSYQQFCKIWKAFKPDIIAMKPRSDLCFTCQINNNLIIKSANLAEDKKSEAFCYC